MISKFCLLVMILFVSQVEGFKDTYVGAVVEYSPVFSINEKSAVSKNLKNYETLMETASKKGADIIVFPENGLNILTILSPVPDPVDKIIPCESTTFETTEIVKNISCAAKKSKIYTVVNLKEIRACEDIEGDCNDKNLTLNTNVVFDRNGMVIARYAKYNLFDETLTNKTQDPELVFFDTDFGVRFGTFTCFDILFYTPTLRLVKQYEITDFVFTTHWFSELPFLTALQAQRGWAESNNVNLLASGYNMPLTGSSGSGIYNGKYGALVELMTRKKGTKLIVANIPVIKTCRSKSFLMSEKFFKENFSFSSKIYSPELEPSEVKEDNEEELSLLSDQIHLYNSEIIKPDTRFEQTICSRNNFCCNFQVKIKQLQNSNSKYVYRAMVSDGVRYFGNTFTGGVQSCGVVLCGGPYLSNCTNRQANIPGFFKFTEINIKGNFLLRNAFQFPSTLTDGKKLLPLSADKYEFKKKEEDLHRIVTLELLWPVTNLHTFAIWGRDFSRDWDPVTIVISNAPLMVSNFALFLTTVALAFWRY